MNIKQKIKKLVRDSDLVFYAHIDKSIDRSEAKEHYETPRNEIEDIGPYARGEIEPDEKYKVKGIENIIIAKEKESGCLVTYCGKEWQFLSDSWYETLEIAKKFVENEYKGINQKWKKLE